MPKVYIGQKEVIQSGVVICEIGEIITFEILSPNGLILKIAFQSKLPFKTNVVLNVINKKTVEIVFENFRNEYLGHTLPIRIGQQGNRGLFFLYRTQGIEGLGMTLQYTIYLGKEGSNGN